MSAITVKDPGLVKFTRVSDVSNERPAPPAPIAKLFPKNKPPKGAIPAAMVLAPSGVWFMWEFLPPKKKGDSFPQRLYWVIDGKLGASKDDFANGFTPSFDLVRRRALVVSEGQVFEVDLDTGGSELLFGRRGGMQSDLVAHLAGDRILVGENTPAGRKLAVYDQSFALQYESFLDGHLLVIGGKSVLGGARAIRLLGLGPSGVRELGKLEPGWVQAPFIDDRRVLFNSKDGRYELEGAGLAWADCFEAGHEQSYPAYVP